VQVEPILQAHRPLVVSAAAVVPLVACAVLSLFRDSVANTNAALGLVLLIVAAASTGIRAAGLVAALSSAAWFDFFLTQPYNHFNITDRADIETAVLLMLVGVAVTEVALWGRRQQARASREQGYLDGVLSTAATVGAGRSSTSSLIDHVCEQIVDVLRIDACRFDPGSGPILAALNNDATVTYNGHPFNVDRLGLPTDSEIALVVQSGGVVHGRFLLTAATRVVRPTLEQLRVTIALANQVGAALAASNLDGRPPGTNFNN
jgi:K+-sensing histidine kinase KdpD